VLKADVLKIRFLCAKMGFLCLHGQLSGRMVKWEKFLKNIVALSLQAVLFWNSPNLTLKNAHPADLVVDGMINELDLGVLASQWLQEPGNPSADIAPWPKDGIVNLLDFAILAKDWLSVAP
jgi:hypothetical protein